MVAAGTRAGAPDPKVAGADRDLLGGFRPREPDSICILRIDVEGTVDSEQTCRIRSVDPEHLVVGLLVRHGAEVPAQAQIECQATADLKIVGGKQ